MSDKPLPKELLPIIPRDPDELPGELPRGGQIPPDLDPLQDGILMKHQADWLADKSDMKAAEKGRRTGITFAEAFDHTLIAAAKRSAGGQNCFYIGDTKEKGREFIGYVQHFAKVVSKELLQIEEFMFQDLQNDGSTKEITAYRARFASGFRVEALSSNPANIRGLQGTVCIDEAAYHKNVREVIDAVNALLIWGGKVRVISTHNGILNAFNELIKEARAGRIPISVHHIPFGDAVKNGLYKRVCFIQGKEWTQEAEDEWEAKIRNSYGTRKSAMRQELDAVPAESEGAALTGVQIENCQVDRAPIVVWQKDDDFRDEPKHIREAEAKVFYKDKLLPILRKLNPKLRHVFGSDFARSGDVSANVFREIGFDLKRRDVFILEFCNIPFEQQRQVLHYCLKRLPRFQGGAMDASGNGAWLAEVTGQEFGSIIHEIKFSREWYRLEMPHYITLIVDGDLEMVKHEDILMDHRALQYVGGIVKVPDDFRFRGSDGRQRHGDTAIAGALCEFACRSDVTIYEHETVDAPRTGLDSYIGGSDDDDDDEPFRMSSIRRTRGLL